MMRQTKNEIIVAGHICLDIFPLFHAKANEDPFRFIPGTITHIGPCRIQPGGAVANTGLALHKLGVSPRLIGKVGEDLFGHAILDAFRSCNPALIDDMIVDPKVATGYSIAFNPPGLDRMFFAHMGANDTFDLKAISKKKLSSTSLLHFGYPPLCRLSHIEQGAQLKILFQKAKAHGVTTSLDMSLPDSNSESNNIDWYAFLENVLPEVDIFLPSFDELFFMLERTESSVIANSFECISHMAGQAIDMGAVIVGIKLGDQGFYIRTTRHKKAIQQGFYHPPKNHGDWTNRELFAPCFEVNVKGTTGAGDCAVAGFLTGILKGLSLEQCAMLAVGMGACNVEKVDAFSGLLNFDELQKRINSGWVQKKSSFDLSDWTFEENYQIWERNNL